MKLIRTKGKGEFTVTEEQVLKIKEADQRGISRIWFEGGDMLDISSIDSITDVPMIKMYKGQKVVDKFGVPSFYDNYCGEVIPIDFPENILEIEDPRYQEKKLSLNGKNI